MSRFPRSPQLAAILALTGCTAAFLAPQEASAYSRQVRPPASRPVLRPAVQPRPMTNVIRPVAPSVRPALAPRPMTLTRPITPFARPVTFPQRIAHPQTSFPRPGLAGGFPRPMIGAQLPRPGTIGAGFPRPFPASAGFPRPNSIGGSFPHVGSLNPGRPNPFPQGPIGGSLQRGAPAASAAPHQSPVGAAGSGSHMRGFSIGSIPIIGPAVKVASKTVGDIAKGDIQKVPGDIASGPIKVVKGTIDQLNPKPAKVSEPKGSTTSDKDFTPAKMSPVQAALLLKHINDMKAAQAAKQAQQGAQTNPSTGTNPATGAQPATGTPQRPWVEKRILEARLHAEQERNQILKNRLAITIAQARQNQFPVFQPASLQSGPVMGGSSGSRPVFQGGGSSGSAVASSAAAPAPAPVSTAPAVSIQPTLPPLPATGPASAPSAISPIAASQPVVNPAQAQPAATEPTVVFVGFKQDLSASDMAAFLQAYKVSIAEGPNQNGAYKLRLNDPLPANLLPQLLDSMRGQTNIVTSVSLS